MAIVSKVKRLRFFFTCIFSMLLIGSCRFETRKDSPGGAVDLMENLQKTFKNPKACQKTLKEENVGADILAVKDASGNVVYELGRTYGKVRLTHLKLTNKSLPPPTALPKTMRKQLKKLSQKNTEISLTGEVFLHVGMEIMEKGKSSIELSRKFPIKVSATRKGKIESCSDGETMEKGELWP